MVLSNAAPFVPVLATEVLSKRVTAVCGYSHLLKPQSIIPLTEDAIPQARPVLVLLFWMAWIRRLSQKSEAKDFTLRKAMETVEKFTEAVIVLLAPLSSRNIPNRLLQTFR
jgi:hypothetical protein